MSKIEWTGDSWNPIRARSTASPAQVGHFCEKVSPGCAGCYAELMNLRSPYLGTRVPFESADHERVEIFLDGAVVEKPLRWRKPRRVFVCSMTDLFLRHHPDEWLDQVFAVMAACPQHTFQVLTKRSGRMLAYLSSHDVGLRWSMQVARLLGRDLVPPPGTAVEWTRHGLPNVWLGVSAENQEQWNARVPVLGQLPAALRWVSAEPLLDEIDPRFDDERFAHVEWVVAGGESGPAARPCHSEHIERLMIECDEHSVPFFLKQFGRRPKRRGAPMTLFDPKGGKPAEWPSRFHDQRRYPETRHAAH